jgi:hypothetical protein
VGEGDADDLVGLSGVAEPLVEADEVGIVPADDPGDHEQDGAHAGTPGADGTLAGALAAVVGDRRQARPASLASKRRIWRLIAAMRASATATTSGSLTSRCRLVWATRRSVS